MNWKCPDCGGGFPEPAEKFSRKAYCPWCGNRMEVSPKESE